MLKEIFRLVGKKKRESRRSESQEDKREFSGSLEKDVQMLRDKLKDCDDVIFRGLELSGRRAYLIYDELLVDTESLNEHILESSFRDITAGTAQSLQKLKERGLPVGEITTTRAVEKCVQLMFLGNAVLLLDGYAEVLLLDIIKWPTRNIEYPDNEPSVRGSKDSFVENLTVNASLLRRRLTTPDFKMVKLKLGRLSPTRLNVCYLESVAHPRLIEETFNRLKQVNIDSLLSDAYLEELIEDEPYSPFPTIMITERPDKAVASLLEGRIVIIQDNSPSSLIFPVVFMQFFQSVDDYYKRYYFGTFIRFIRVVALFLTIYLPALYVAITTFHQEMMPTTFAISLQVQREGIPFPAVFEAVSMGFAFEILREAGLRLPRSFGQAVSIVGALIVGEAATQAQLVAPAMVIVTAVTAIASFTIPTQVMNEPILLIRLVLTIVSGILGLWGILIFTLLLLGHLASLRSFGMPYLAPAAPLVPEDLDDFLVRAPLWQMKTRPRLLALRNLLRQGKRPSPAKKGTEPRR